MLPSFVEKTPSLPAEWTWHLLKSHLTTDIWCTAQFHLSTYLTLCSDHSADFEIEIYDSSSLDFFQIFFLYIGGSVRIPHGTEIVFPYSLPSRAVRPEGMESVSEADSSLCSSQFHSAAGSLYSEGQEESCGHKGKPHTAGKLHVTGKSSRETHRKVTVGNWDG